MTGKPTPRDAAVKIVGMLQEAGYVAYLAGGCVRDALLGYHPKDYDVATDAKPDAVRGLFPKSRYVGEAFGVVQVRVPGYRHHPVEVATFRTEWGYQDGRRPTSVHFTDAQHDAQRRDFTINGLFEDPLAEGDDQRIIDFVGGQRDLRAGVVRAIGDPAQRFDEDYLRMLRAVRFATRLGFEIEPATADAIRPLAPKLAAISRERIGQELRWMLTPSRVLAPQRMPGATGGERSGSGPLRGGADPRAARAIGLIQDLHLDGPTLDEPHLVSDLATVSGLARGLGSDTEQAVATGRGLASGSGEMEMAIQTPSYATYLAAWLLDRYFFQDTSQPCGALGGDGAVLAGAMERFVSLSSKPIVRGWRRALCLSNEDRGSFTGVLTLLPVALRWPGLGVAGRKRLLAQVLWPQVWALIAALRDRPGVGALVAQIASDAPTLWTQGVCPEPWVSGDDLIALGRKPGPVFRRLLDQVYDAQLEGRLTSKDQALDWLKRQP